MGKKIGRCLKAKQKKKTKSTIKTAEKESRLLRQIHSGNGIAGVSKNAVGATLGAVLARRGITASEGAGSGVASTPFAASSGKAASAISARRNIDSRGGKKVAPARKQRRVAVVAEDDEDEEDSDNVDPLMEEDDQQVVCEEEYGHDDDEDFGPLTARKERNLLRKQHVAEKIALKKHIKELQERRVSRTKGPDSKNDRRDMGRYIRGLQQEQEAKHAEEMAQVEVRVQHEEVMGMDRMERALHRAGERRRAQLQEKLYGGISGVMEGGASGGYKGWADDETRGVGNDMSETELQCLFANLTAL